MREEYLSYVQEYVGRLEPYMIDLEKKGSWKQVGNAVVWLNKLQFLNSKSSHNWTLCWFFRLEGILFQTTLSIRTASYSAMRSLPNQYCQLSETRLYHHLGPLLYPHIIYLSHLFRKKYRFCTFWELKSKKWNIKFIQNLFQKSWFIHNTSIHIDIDGDKTLYGNEIFKVNSVIGKNKNVENLPAVLSKKLYLQN